MKLTNYLEVTMDSPARAPGVIVTLTVWTLTVKYMGSYTVLPTDVGTNTYLLVIKQAFKLRISSSYCDHITLVYLSDLRPNKNMLQLTDVPFDVYVGLENHTHRRSTKLEGPQGMTFIEMFSLIL